MRIPSATYRVQFNKDFRFEDARAIVPDLHRLGVTHLYASPVFVAREASTHGYDVVDPTRLNPVLGTEAEFEALVSDLKSHDMGMVLDIVPNHMAASSENPWWMDLLENGPASQFGSFFGVNWGANTVADKIFLPVLGSPYGQILESQELVLSFDEHGFFVNYWALKLPIDPATYGIILDPPVAELASVMETIQRMPDRRASEWEALASRIRDAVRIKHDLWALYQQPSGREYIDAAVDRFRGEKGKPASFDALHNLLEAQAYQLAFWKVATEKVNYRRFFDVTDLVGIRVENPNVFEATHALVFRLVNEAKVEGLRVDHIDGLFDPGQYLDRLSALGAYVVVEKILCEGEELPDGWPIQGTTGYEFLGFVNALFVDEAGLERVTSFYNTFVGSDATLVDIEYERKKQVMDQLFTGEMLELGSDLAELAVGDRYARDLSPKDLRQSLVEITACMPVYRTYTSAGRVSDRDLGFIQIACAEARRRNPELSSLVFDFTQHVLEHPEGEQRLQFTMRWQQITGPIMAKGVEDCAFYVYNRLVSLNEVGSIPRPVSMEEFHTFQQRRLAAWPGTMNATSTHDTKRSEDVRARINVISEIPAEWERLAARWSRWMGDKRGEVTRNEEYLLYQVLLGAWPLRDDEVPAFRDRLKAYMVKAAREARTNTSWLYPSDRHELALTEFVDALFDDARFLESFGSMAEKLAFYGAMNSLSQVLLKITSPGVPDFYQGTVDWDFSLVDPDNRRPVKWPDLTDFAEKARDVLDHWRDGQVKVFLIERALAFRKAHPDLFLNGEYIPLTAQGKRASNIIAFARRSGEDWAVILAPRLLTQLSIVVRPPIGMRAWRDTTIALPEGAPVRWRNVITGEPVNSQDGHLPLFRALDHFPVALLSGR
jgi:(1->4)-alpha-D-glucan 1-alpha-D-glucosylmutase